MNCSCETAEGVTVQGRGRYSKEAGGTIPGPILVLARGKRVLDVHGSGASNITVGRSSRCELRVDDPHFPRCAGEVIFRPEPLFRTSRRGDDKRIVSLLPGKYINLHSYRLYLLDERTFLMNRKRKHLLFPISWHRSVLPVAAAAVMFLVAATGIHVPDKAGCRPAPLSMTIPVSLTREGTATPQSPDISSPAGELIMDNPLFKTVSENVSGSGIDACTIRKAGGSTKFDRGLSAGKESQADPAFPQASLDRVIAAACKLITDGNPAAAGRIVKPTLSLLSEDQKNLLVNHLDPPLAKLFQEAYVLRPYDSCESALILKMILNSGLELLPAYRKAARLLTSIDGSDHSSP